MARDFRGVPFSTLPEPTAPDFTFRLRNMLSEIDAWARDTSQGMGRISRGEVPDGSGDPISPAEVDLSDYFFLPGRAAGQTGYGSTASAGSLILGSTAHATKGFVYIGSNQLQLIFDETQNLLGLNATPAATLHIEGSPIGGTSSAIVPNADQFTDWVGPYTGFGGTPIGGTLSAAMASNDDETSYAAMDVGGVSSVGHGTNPQRCGLNGTIVPGATYEVTIRLSALFTNPDPTLNYCTISLVDSAGNEWADSESNNEGMEAISTHSVFHTVTRTVVCSGTPSNTGQTANSLRISVGMQQSITTGIYCAVSYVGIALAAADIMRWDLYNGTLSGRINYLGHLGIGTGSDTLDPMLVVESDAAATIGQKIKGFTAQSGNLLEFRTQADALLSRFTSAGVLDGPIDTTSTATLRGVTRFEESTASLNSPVMVCVASVGTYSGYGPVLDDLSGFLGEFQTSNPLTADRAWAFPDANGNVVIDGGAIINTLDLGVSSTLRANTAASGASFRDNTTSTKRLRMILSGAVGNNNMVIATTAARGYTFGDVSSGVTQLGVAASAAGTLGRIVLTGQNGSLGAQTLLTGTTVSAGLYRVSFYLKTTTGGDAADNVTVTLAWNEGTAQTEVLGFLGSTSSIAPYTAHDLFVNNSFSHADVVVRVAASQNITFTTTLTSPGAGTPVYTIDARLEYLG